MTAPVQISKLTASHAAPAGMAPTLDLIIARAGREAPDVSVAKTAGPDDQTAAPAIVPPPPLTPAPRPASRPWLGYSLAAIGHALLLTGVMVFLGSAGAPQQTSEDTIEVEIIVEAPGAPGDRSEQEQPPTEPQPIAEREPEPEPVKQPTAEAPPQVSPPVEPPAETPPPEPEPKTEPEPVQAPVEPPPPAEQRAPEPTPPEPTPSEPTPSEPTPPEPTPPEPMPPEPTPPEPTPPEPTPPEPPLVEKVEPPPKAEAEAPAFLPPPKPAPKPAPKAAPKAEPAKPQRPRVAREAPKQKQKQKPAERPVRRPVAQARPTGGGGANGRRAVAGQNSMSVDAFRAAVIARIARNKPSTNIAALAQGVVVVTFGVSSGGAAQGTRVLRSSGNAILDNAALQTIRRASPFPPPPPGAPRSFNVPIRFNAR